MFVCLFVNILNIASFKLVFRPSRESKRSWTRQPRPRSLPIAVTVRPTVQAAHQSPQSLTALLSGIAVSRRSGLQNSTLKHQP